MKRTLMFVLVTALVPAAAYAQSQPAATPTGEDTGKLDAPTSPQALPPPKSDNDTAPPVAAPASPAGGLVEQAGTGGSTGYGRAGVLELGGSAGFRAGSGFNQVAVAPSMGWFLADNLELTGIMDVNRVSMNSDSTTVVTALVEPSYHLPFNRSVFGFLGIGMGASYVGAGNLGTGFAMAPRLGANLMVGRSGILTPSLSWQYTTHNVMNDAANDITVVAVSSAVRLNVGYTVMW